MKPIWLFPLFFLTILSPLQAANPDVPISARAEASKGATTIGEPVEYKIVVRYKKDVEILNSISDPEMPGFEIKDSKNWDDREGQFRIIGKTFQVSTYQLGNFMIEPIEISYRIKNGSAQTIKTNPVYISVKSIAEGEAKEDIRDVKGVVKLPYRLLKPLIISGSILLILGLLAAYLLYFRKKESEANRLVEKLSPRDQALRDLHELFESSLIREGKIKQYYLRFSEILKIFLEKQFGLQATEATTSEISTLLRRLTISDDSKKRLIDVLEASDFAKFAKWIPSAADVLALNQQAEAVVGELAMQNQGVESNAVS